MSAVGELQTNGQQDLAPTAADDTPDLVQDRGSNDEQDEVEDDHDDDLFGSDNDETLQKQKRALDDQELDSGDDLGRDDRVADTVEDAEDQDQAVGEGGRPTRLIDCDVPRINYPKGDEFYLLNMPNFLGIKQEAFNPETYEPQTLPHDGDSSRQTSAYSTAMSSMFWRRDPHDAAKMQSTARFVRWEDGSITLQLATKPTEQYRVNAQPLRQGFGKKITAATPYDPAKDSLTFLAAAHSTQVVDLQLVHALDASMKILPTGGEQDEAELRLKQLMAATRQEGISLARTKEVEEDPELARKQAEQFEKDRMRAQRKRDNAEERLTMKRNNVLGRAGLGGGRGGLSVAGLEDDMGMPLSRGKKKPKRKMNRHGEIYSDDEDETMPRGRTREDEYDREDEFLADSDEEPEQYGDDDLLDDEEDDPDKDDLEIQGKKTVVEDRPRKERERTPKRSRMDELDEDEDAEGEPDDELLRQSPQQVRKKRRVVEDEDDEE